MRSRMSYGAGTIYNCDTESEWHNYDGLVALLDSKQVSRIGSWERIIVLNVSYIPIEIGLSASGSQTLTEAPQAFGDLGLRHRSA